MFNFGIRTDLIILADLITSTQKITKKPRETAQRGERYTLHATCAVLCENVRENEPRRRSAEGAHEVIAGDEYTPHFPFVGVHRSQILRPFNIAPDHVFIFFNAGFIIAVCPRIFFGCPYLKY